MFCSLTMFFFFFFKQKTAYEMRISDWSSDVCSSDLVHRDRESKADPFVSFHLMKPSPPSLPPSQWFAAHRAIDPVDRPRHFLLDPPLTGPGDARDIRVAQVVDPVRQIGRAHV